MTFSSYQRVLTIAISLVWLVNGLFYKVLNFVPRHQQIVARILGEDCSWLLTKAIGFSEVLVFVWIVSGIQSRWCTIFPLVIVSVMNVIEFVLASDLLLFGKWNAVFAFLFLMMVFVNEFLLKKQISI
ncbi:MAG: DoxX-like family protein [Bacteroidota bacterium]